jgi:hypothetical protein
MAQFEKGQSGNPSGRPVGIRDKRTAMRELLQPHAPDLIAKAVEMAKGGDAAALRICLDRLLPAAKPKDEAIELPGMTGSPADRGRVVLDALAAGEVTPDEAGAVMQALAAQVRIVEADELEKRITALEQAATNKGQ